MLAQHIAPVELFAVTLLVALGLLPLLFISGVTKSRGRRLSLVLAWLTASAALTVLAIEYREPLLRSSSLEVTNRPVEVASDGYVSSKSCKACHEDTYASWHASYHRRMTQVLTPETLQSDVDGQVLEHLGKTYRLSRRGDEFWVELEDPDWGAGKGPAPRIELPFVMSTGSHHYEALWFATNSTRKVSLLPFAWRIEEKCWMPLDAAFLVPPGELQGLEGRWNRTCSKCHATHSKPLIRSRYEMETQVAEFGIACEACHGPGEEHVRENGDPRIRYASHFGDAPDRFIVNPSRLDSARSSMICGQCHAATDFKSEEQAMQWNLEGFTFRPGQDLHDTLKFKEVAEEKFWSDGMIRTSGREYNGLLDSPCYSHGDQSKGILGCLSCHSMHKKLEDPRTYETWANDQLKLGMDGDLACTQCHSQFNDRERLEEHTRHRSASGGSRCMNCHMPYTTYGLLKSIRSHTISSPTLEESLSVGRPNACNLCHLDQTLEWTGQKLHEWYGHPTPESHRQDSGLTSDENEVAALILWILSGDAGLRALTALSMNWSEARVASRSDWFAPYLGQLLMDPYHAVRFLSARSLRSLPDSPEITYDFMGSLAERKQSLQAVREHWLKRDKSGTFSHGTQLLIRPDGKLEVERFGKLLRKRDDRRVTLSE